MTSRERSAVGSGVLSVLFVVVIGLVVAVVVVKVDEAKTEPRRQRSQFHLGYAQGLDLAQRTCEANHGTDPAVDWAALWVGDGK